MQLLTWITVREPRQVVVLIVRDELKLTLPRKAAELEQGRLLFSPPRHDVAQQLLLLLEEYACLEKKKKKGQDAHVEQDN